MSDEVYKGARGSDYGSPAEQREWLKRGTQQRTRDTLLRQFQKLESGLGNSDAYREGYDAINWSATKAPEPAEEDATVPWYACDLCGMTRELTRVVLDPIDGCRRLCRKCEDK